MTTLKKDLQAVVRELKALQKKVEKVVAAADKPATKAKPVKAKAKAKAKVAKKKKAAPKKAAKKKVVKKPATGARKKVMQTIKRLRNNGKSYGEITKYLDSKGIATFSGKGKWHAQTIANLLKSL